MAPLPTKSIGAGVEPVFQYFSELGSSSGENREVAWYVVAANVCRWQLNSIRMVQALLRSSLKGLTESTLMTLTGASIKHREGRSRISPTGVDEDTGVAAQWGCYYGNGRFCDQEEAWQDQNAQIGKGRTDLPCLP